MELTNQRLIRQGARDQCNDHVILYVSNPIHSPSVLSLFAKSRQSQALLDQANVSKCPLTPLARPTLVHLNFVFGYKMESET